MKETLFAATPESFAGWLLWMAAPLALGLWRQLPLVVTLTMVLLPACEKNGETTAPAAPAQAQRQESTLPTESLQLAGETFTVELAFTRADRERGLMFRDHLDADRGMLFVFDESREQMFWMKNCRIDMDILFIRDDGVIARITTMKKPQPGKPLRRYYSDAPVRYALELAAGTARRLGLSAGDAIDLPRRIRTIIPEPD